MSGPPWNESVREQWRVAQSAELYRQVDCNYTLKINNGLAFATQEHLFCKHNMDYHPENFNHSALDIPQSGHNVANIASFIYAKNLIIIIRGAKSLLYHSDGVQNIALRYTRFPFLRCISWAAAALLTTPNGT
jgi:hypothetical protein